MKNTKKLVLLALMVAIGAVLQIIESTLPQIMPLPGGKLGFANIVSMLVIPLFGGASAVAVAAVRALLGGLLYGGFISTLYSLAGAVLSAAVMAVCYQKFYGKLSFMGIGCIGAVCHNTAQVLVGVALLQDIKLLSYLPVLLVISAISGTATGFAANFFCKYNERLIR